MMKVITHDDVGNDDANDDVKIMMLRNVVREQKRDYVGKIPKRRTPPPTPPVWEFSHFFTVFVKLVMPFYKLLNWKKQ